MYPAQASLMPIQVALIRYLEQGGSPWSSYPYWYLGTTPFRYLTGPVVPGLLFFWHKILPAISLFDLMLALVGLSFLTGGVGLYWLVKEIEAKPDEQEKQGNIENQDGRRKRMQGISWVALLATFFYLAGWLVPWLFSYGDGIRLISLSLLPYILVFYYRFLTRRNPKNSLGLIFLLVTAWLIDTSTIIPVIIAILALFLCVVGWHKTETKLKATLLASLLALSLVTIWYTPGYWLTVLKAPSFGGKPAWQVIFNLGKILPVAIAFGAALISAKMFKGKNKLRDFVFYWVFIVGSLTFFRFLADPDWWLDWSVYHIELQMGMAIGLGMLTRKYQRDKKYKKYQKCQVIIWLATGTYIIVGLIIFRYQVIGNLRQNISDTVEYRVSNRLNEIAKKDDRVFLSGSVVFWLNALVDIPQVRGGKDQASVDQKWRGSAWELREGTNPKRVLGALRELKTTYLVLHTDQSEEYYHDYQNIGRFNTLSGLVKISEEKGNVIFKLAE